MTPKKNNINNINAIYPALIIAHNAGNKSAISKDICLGAGIDNIYLVKWSADVEKLRKIIWDYFKTRVEVQNGRKSEHDLEVMFNRCFPAWKNLLQQGERAKDVRELHADKYDIEDLIGFAWDFFWIEGMEVGTQIAATDSKKFRQKVEALIGCKIAGVAVLTAAQQKTINDYHRAVNTAKSIEAEQVTLAEELKKAQTLYDAVKALDDEKYGEIQDKFLGELKELTDRSKDLATKLTTARADAAALEKKAKKIEKDLKTAQI